jgi:CheY-like chemotaxis protein
VKRLILLADDSSTIQRLVSQTFAGGEFDVVCVSNGDAAVRKFEEVRPDVVLADIYMPGKNGYEVCAAIKKHAEMGDTPVVLLAGAFDAFDHETANQVGAVAHITKPFEPQALVNLVTSLAPRGSGRERPAMPTMPPPFAKKEFESPLRKVESETEFSSIQPEATSVMERSTAPIPVVASEPPIVHAMDPATTAASPSAFAPPMAPIAPPAPPAAPLTPAAPAIPPDPVTPVPPSVAAQNVSTESGDLLGLNDLFKPEAGQSHSLASVSDAEIERIAERVIQKLSTQVIESVAWDVVPDITAKVLKEELKRRS